MKPITVPEWIEALRSGRYKQGMHVLRDGDKFCCLGVAADLAGAEWEPHTDKLHGTVYIVEGHEATLASHDDNARYDLRPKMGEVGAFLLWHDPWDSGYREMHHWSYVANDNGKTFAEIAEHLEDAYTRWKGATDVRG